MAYLGYDGIVAFQRTQPEPVVVPISAVNKPGNYITVHYDDWLLAESVYVVHSGGVVSGYIHRDSLDRVYLHINKEGALANLSATRISLDSVNVSKPVVLAAIPNGQQLTILNSFQLALTTVASETRMRAWATDWNNYKNAATEEPYKIQGELKRWQFSRSAPEADIGAIGDRFGTFTKAVVSGSGTMDFIVRFYESDARKDIDHLLNLVQLTEHGCTAMTRFYLKQATVEASEIDATPVNAALYFETSILITSSAIDVDNSDVILGSASFVTTGQIRLLSSQS